ncbi:MAG: tetratricopeptide repeat protein [Bacteroidota bacterium]
MKRVILICVLFLFPFSLLCFSQAIKQAEGFMHRYNSGTRGLKIGNTITLQGISFTHVIHDITKGILPCGYEKCNIYSFYSTITNHNPYTVRLWLSPLNIKDESNWESEYAYYRLGSEMLLIGPGQTFTSIAECKSGFGSEANINPADYEPVEPAMIDFTFSYANWTEALCDYYIFQANGQESGYEGDFVDCSYENAIKLFNTALQYCPGKEDYIQSRIASISGKMNTTATPEKIITDNNKCEELLEMADSYYYSGDMEQSESYYRQALAMGTCDNGYIKDQLAYFENNNSKPVQTTTTATVNKPEKPESDCKCSESEILVKQPEYFYDEKTNQYIKTGDCICESIMKNERIDPEDILNYCGYELDRAIEDMKGLYSRQKNSFSVDAYIEKLENISSLIFESDCIPTEEQMAKWADLILALGESFGDFDFELPDFDDPNQRIHKAPKCSRPRINLPNPGVVIIDGSQNNQKSGGIIESKPSESIPVNTYASPNNEDPRNPRSPRK